MGEARTGRFLSGVVRRLGMLGSLALVGAFVLISCWTKDEFETLGSANGLPDERRIVRAELVEFWASEGFSDLAAAVAGGLEEPKWHEVRKLMEARGCTQLQYLLRIRWFLDDGSTDELTYMRRPYDEPQHVREFLRLLREGLGSMELFPAIDRPPDESDPDGVTCMNGTVVDRFVNGYRS